MYVMTTPLTRKEIVHRSYLKHKARYRELARIKRQKMREYVQEQKSKPCADCSHTYHYCVMDFDHRDDKTKTGDISRLYQQSSWKRLLAEIAKCDLVCANCHRLRTFRRAYSEPKAQ